MMNFYTTKPIKELSRIEFQELLSNKRFVISFHASDHLSSEQRKVFKGRELVDMIRKEKPRKIYLQKNGRYAACYRRKYGYRKVLTNVV
jgi:hypothetical protein